jgi:hypothetical protein
MRAAYFFYRIPGGFKSALTGVRDAKLRHGAVKPRDARTWTALGADLAFI